MLGNNLVALIVTLALALAWLRLNDWLAHRGLISSQLSRKIIHTGTGPIFVLCWLLFKNDTAARFIAAIIPLGITLQFVAVGVGWVKDQASVDAMSRTGNRGEILKGPLYYGIAFVVLTIAFWYDTPIGIIALMVLCGGDGLADIIGKRWTTHKLPWSKEKTWGGSTAMFLGGWILSVLVIWAFILAGKFSGSLSGYLLPITVIAGIGAIVESVPAKDIDNITVTAASVLLGFFFF